MQYINISIHIYMYKYMYTYTFILSYLATPPDYVVIYNIWGICRLSDEHMALLVATVTVT